MTIKYSKQAAKYLQSVEKNLRNRLRTAIEGLTESPPRGDIKPMEGTNDGTLRLRVGGYRVVYKYIADNIVVLYVIAIGPRGDIYK